ncbi:BAG family molecular chaperone regulator 3-like [Typha angustifolia]|uniref:BAG family molecular chaperone regulator 3-like n=1 Tax=Typha angustifolia TaxID=59011 RepID=UPI003C2B2A08
MMRVKAKSAAAAAVATATAFSPMKETAAAAEDELEVRPGGMLVQKRNPDSEAAAVPVPTIRVKVKYAGVYHEIYISSQASFGELKKMLSARTGLHPEDQKLVYKDKERDSKAFLDTCGVKDRSKIVLLEDPTAQAKRLLEMRRTDKMEKAAKSISRISLEVDKLASKVSALETIVNKGGKVVENDVINLTELLMNELIKLDAIVADGDIKAQRRIQVKRVQKYVETLDVIKVKNATPKANGQQINKPQPPPQPQPQPQSQYKPPQPPQQQQQQQQQRRQFQQPAPAVVTTNWETFDLLSSLPSTSSATSTTTMATYAASPTPTPRFDWELF